MSTQSDTAQQTKPHPAPAGPDFKVSLIVRPGPSDGKDRYSNTVADNGDIYCYLYMGGNEDGGNVQVEFDEGGGPSAIIQVSISRESMGGVQRYNIKEIIFNGTDKTQFGSDANGKSHVANITDKNIGLANVKYTTWVYDKTARCSFPCDPMIKNVPRVL